MTLYEKIQNVLKKTYREYEDGKLTAKPRTGINRLSLTNKLQSLYRSKPSERGNNLVPFDDSTLSEDAPIYMKKRIQGQEEERYGLNYRWNKDPNKHFDAEFLGDPEIIGTVPVGMVLDRIGDEDGSYMCPVQGQKTYSVGERAIPYLFLEDTIAEEPAYHTYEVVQPISVAALLSKLAHASLSDDVKENLRRTISFKGIRFGTVAPVPAFGRQGGGHGLQYAFPIKVRYLREFGFVEKRD